MYLFEESWVEEHIIRVVLDHLQESRQCVWHVVVVAEDLFSVTGPDVFPDGGRVCADAIDEPLRIVVQCDLERSMAADD